MRATPGPTASMRSCSASLSLHCCCCRFCSDAGKYALECVLRAYAALDPEVGYCQGMNFLAGLLLCWLPSPADAFGALVVVMQERGLRELYKRDLAMLQVHSAYEHVNPPLPPHPQTHTHTPFDLHLKDIHA